MVRRNEDHKGTKVCRESPFITHLFFADDSIIFDDASEDGVRVIQDTLQLYERASG